MSDRRDEESFNLRVFLTYGFLIFLIAISFNAFDAYLRVTPSVTSGDLTKDLGVDAQSLGLLVTLYFIPYVVLQIPVGLLIDRYGVRWFLAAAAALSALGSLVFGLATGLGLALIARLMMGVGGAFPGVGPVYLASRWFPHRYLGLLAGLIATSTVVGSIGGEAFLVMLLEFIDWRDASFIAAGFGLVVALLIVVIVRDQPKAKQGQAVEPPQRLSGSEVWAGVTRIFASRQNWINALWGGLVLMPMLAFAGLWAAPFLVATHGVDTQTAANATAALFIGLAFGGPISSIISERLKSRRLPMMLLAGSACLASLVILYLPGLPFLAIYPLFVLLGFCLGAQPGLVFVVALEINPRRTAGLATGFTQAMSNLGGAMFPPLIGFLLTRSSAAEGGAVASYTASDFQLALSVIPIALGVAVVLAFLLRETYGDEVDGLG